MSDVMTANDGDARKNLQADLQALNFSIHQADDPPLFTPVPKPTMVPCHWKHADIMENLDRIGRDIKLEHGSVRRTLRLGNPGLEYGTTPTIWASIQFINPGEVATAHRHTASALRFIMHGKGANTIVDGEQYQMNEGDLVFTPNGAWHDHEHLGDEPMIWLDVLDISLVRSLEAVFYEGSDAPRQPVLNNPQASFSEYGSGIMRPTYPSRLERPNPLLAYPKARMEDAIHNAAMLEPDPHDDTILEFSNPLTGGPANPTIGTFFQRLRPGISLKPHRHTGSSVYHVVRGNGQTVVDDDVFEWAQGDFFSVPPWAKHAHANRSDSDDCLLFQVNDFPVMKTLGLWREETDV
ncbi:cupin domain-containing protein [Hoeflea poritis]|uniref:Cupin domain-containing protein n=1 Tax=Hoeflea poritis TaxID=2993659 RepID=A0ABT4VUW8_9HYPH|nr:cupin domain-containing protein [Hoeflea poritis]MDA4848523.1 cupin domain-containing protein [Hoeflea poritis]